MAPRVHNTRAGPSFAHPRLSDSHEVPQGSTAQPSDPAEEQHKAPHRAGHTGDKTFLPFARVSPHISTRGAAARHRGGHLPLTAQPALTDELPSWQSLPVTALRKGLPITAQPPPGEPFQTALRNRGAPQPPTSRPRRSGRSSHMAAGRRGRVAGGRCLRWRCACRAPPRAAASWSPGPAPRRCPAGSASFWQFLSGGRRSWVGSGGAGLRPKRSAENEAVPAGTMSRDPEEVNKLTESTYKVSAARGGTAASPRDGAALGTARRLWGWRAGGGGSASPQGRAGGGRRAGWAGSAERERASPYPRFMSNLAHPSAPEPARWSLPRRELGAVAHGAAAAAPQPFAGVGTALLLRRSEFWKPRLRRAASPERGWGLMAAGLRLNRARDGTAPGRAWRLREGAGVSLGWRSALWGHPSACWRGQPALRWQDSKLSTNAELLAEWGGFCTLAVDPWTFPLCKQPKAHRF